VRLGIQWLAKRDQIASLAGQDDPTTAAQRRQLQSLTRQLVQTLSWIIFALTCVSHKTRLFQSGGVLATPINSVFQAVSPPHLSLPMWARGLLGVVAVSCDFLN